MIATWYDLLRFFYCPVNADVTSDELEHLERELNSAWMPPYVKLDLDATIRQMRRAFHD